MQSLPRLGGVACVPVWATLCLIACDVSEPHGSARDSGSGTLVVDAARPLTPAIEVEHPLCDGSMDIVFAARAFPEERDFAPPFMTRAGSSYLYVRGDCAFWSNGGPSSWVTTSQGVLTAEQERELARDLGRQGECDPQHLRGGSAALQIYDGCLHYVGIDSIWPTFRSWLLRLAELGLPMAADMRVLAVHFHAASFAADPRTQELRLLWLPGWSLDTLVAERDGAGVLIAGEQANDLRALRERYVHGGAVVVAGDESRQGEFSFWTGRDAADLYQVWFRDRLPFEDETGAVPLPPR